MSNFKVGDRVVCVDDSFEDPQDLQINTLKKGAHYIVHSIRECRCGDELNVGAVAIIKESAMCQWKCGCTHKLGKITTTFKSSRFRKVIEQPRVIRIEVERTEPVLN